MIVSLNVCMWNLWTYVGTCRCSKEIDKKLHVIWCISIIPLFYSPIFSKNTNLSPKPLLSNFEGKKLTPALTLFRISPNFSEKWPFYIWWRNWFILDLVKNLVPLYLIRVWWKDRSSLLAFFFYQFKNLIKHLMKDWRCLNIMPYLMMGCA